VTEILKLENMALRDGIYYAQNTPDAVELGVVQEGLDSVESINDTSFWHKHRVSCIIAALDRVMPTKNGAGYIADVGGGNGFIVKELENAGYEAILFEPLANGANNAKKRAVKNIVCGLFDATTVKEGSMSAVGLFDVLEHIENDGQFICGLLPLLTDEGKVVVTVPAHHYLWSSKDDYAFHYRRYTVPSLRELFMQNGFDVLFATYIFSLLLPIMLFAKALPYRLFGKQKPKTKDVQNDAPSSENLQTFADEHQRRGAGLLLHLLKHERAFIKRGKRIPFGASVLLVAQKHRD
jgi:SAM-dependent methyltransferase